MAFEAKVPATETGQVLMTLPSSLPALTLLPQQCHKQRTAQKGPTCTPHKSLTQKKQQLHNRDLVSQKAPAATDLPRVQGQGFSGAWWVQMDHPLVPSALRVKFQPQRPGSHSAPMFQELGDTCTVVDVARHFLLLAAQLPWAPSSPGTLRTPASSLLKAIRSLCLSLSCPHGVGQLARGHLAMAHGSKGSTGLQRGRWHKSGADSQMLGLRSTVSAGL